jgi:Calx-beta domain/IPT/TIG domain/PKD domain
MFRPSLLLAILMFAFRAYSAMTVVVSGGWTNRCIMPSLNVCYPGELTFSIANTSQYGSLTWNFGDGFYGGTQYSNIPVTHSYSNYGDYTVTAVLSPSGNTATAVVHVVSGVVTADTEATGTEGSTAKVRVIQNEYLSGTVHYTMKNLTAAAGQRYVSSSGTVSFNYPFYAVVEVPLIDDHRFDDPQTFEVDFDSISPSSLYLFHTKCIVTIVDNDPPPTFAMSASRYDVREESGTAAVTIRRTGDSLRTVNVTYATEPSAHIQPVSGSVTFAPGETTKTINVPIVNDGVYEGPVEAVFKLGSVDASGMKTDPMSARIVIADDEPAPSISVSDVTVREGDIAEITLTASGTLYEEVVPLQIGGGTATASTDYVSPDATAVAFHNTTKATIRIPVRDDAKVEENETFTIRSGGRLNAARIGTVTIVDDDAQLTPVLLLVHPNASGLLTFQWGQPLTAGGKVAIAVTGGVSAPAEVKAPAGATSVGVPVTVSESGGTLIATLARGNLTVAATANVEIVSGAVVLATPSPLTARAGHVVPLSLSLDPPQSTRVNISVVAGDAATIDVPSTVAIDPGATAIIDVTAKKIGDTEIKLFTSSGVTTTVPVSVSEDGAPVITSITPGSGPVTGGTRVAVHGLGLDAGCRLLFDSLPGTNVTVSSDGFEATSPPHAAGSVALTVSCGGSDTAIDQRFVYYEPRRRPAH